MERVNKKQLQTERASERERENKTKRYRYARSTDIFYKINANNTKDGLSLEGCAL